VDRAPDRPVIVTKIRPPRRRRDIVARPRLHQYLSDNLDRKLILVSAGAGYGKTSLLVDFCHAAQLPLCWYRVEAADADPPAFYEHLIAALRQRYPGVAERTRLMLAGEEKLDIEAVIGSLVNEIADGIPELFLLVLDDYQNLDEAVVVNAGMDLLLHYLPDNCRVILASRTLPRKLTLTRLAGEGQVAGLGRDALRFNREEIRELVAQQHGRQLRVAQLAGLESLTEGWVAALVLASERLLDEAPLRRAEGGTDLRQLYDYLADEVLAGQTEDAVAFLLRTSLLETLTPALCDAVLERSDSAAMLEDLEAQNLFLVPFDAEGTWYRYHPLFHEFLQSRLERAPAAEVAGLHRRAAAWYLAEDLPESAVPHLLGAGDVEAAADVMEAQVNALASGGRWRQIRRWVKALPEAILAERPKLSDRLGVADVQLGDIREGLEALNVAVAAFEARDNVAGLVTALVQRAPALRLLGRLAEAEADSQRALQLVAGSPAPPRADETAGEAYRNLGACSALHGNLVRARAELEAALACFERADSATLAAHTHSDLAALYQLAGDTDAALSHSEAARRHYEAVGNVAALTLAMNNSAVALHAQGRFEDAQALLTEAAELARSAGVMRTEALVSVGLGDVLADQDAFGEATVQYRRGLALARQVGEMPLVVYGVAACAEALRLEGRGAEGRSLLAAASEEIAPYHYAYESALLAYVRGTLALDHLALADAAEHLGAAQAAFRSMGAGREEARSMLYGVALAARAGDRAAADTAWREAVRRLGQLKYPEALAPTARRLPEVQERLKGAGTRLQRALAPGRGRGPVRSSAPPRSGTRPPPGEPPAPLTVLALGRPEVRLGEALLAGANWQTTVARDLFLYLIDRPDGATALELMATFWPESPETRARGVLHSTVYRARAAVGRERLMARDNRYWVPRAPDLAYDVAELEGKLALAAAVPDERARLEALEAGLGLVRGPYLEGMAEDWCHGRREALELVITEALMSLADAYLRLGQPADAVATYRRAIERDHLREDAHRGLMRSYAALGDRTRALVQYERLVAVLRDELAADPDAATTALEHAIRAETPLPPDDGILMRPA
jgi:ATP/maltotriose-dependent transcriptional regulator MalT/DNA-binding SARP family transcriptional activator